MESLLNNLTADTIQLLMPIYISAFWFLRLYILLPQVLASHSFPLSLQLYLQVGMPQSVRLIMNVFVLLVLLAVLALATAKHGKKNLI